MKAIHTCIVTLGLLSSCASGPVTPHYPNQEPVEESSSTEPNCDMGGPPRDCKDHVRFEQSGIVTVMVAPQCSQITVAEKPKEGEEKMTRWANTYRNPHTRTVVGESDANLEAFLCLQFPLSRWQEERSAGTIITHGECLPQMFGCNH